MRRTVPLPALLGAPRVLAGLLATAHACTAVAPDSDGTARPFPPDTADSGVQEACRSGDPGGLDAAYRSDRGNHYRVVSVPLQAGGEGVALVTFPAGPARFWADGAAVVVVSPPAHTVDPTWETHPQSWARPWWGVVEVVPVWPGFSVQGVRAPGDGDGGGAASAALLAAVIDFALGGPSAEGRPLEDYAEVPVCNAHVGLLGLSSGGGPLLRAVAEHGAAVTDRVAGVSLFEPPSLPELQVAEAGAIWMDPQVAVDADADDIAWNDGRNLSLDPATCAAAGCSPDYSSLRWAAEFPLAEQWSGYPADLPPGALYFDRDGNGRFDLDEDGRTDADHDGRVAADEDTWARPLFADAADTYHLYYSPGMTRAAVAAGLLPPSGGPVAGVAEADAWWAERSMGLWARSAAAALPDARWGVTFTAMPHGPALVERTGERIVFDELREGGAQPEWNFPRDLALCLAGSAFDTYAGPPPSDPALGAGEMQAWAVPEVANSVTIQAVTGLAPLALRHGEPAECPERED